MATSTEGGSAPVDFTVTVDAQPDGLDQTSQAVEGSSVSGNIFIDDIDIGGATDIAGLSVTGLSGLTGITTGSDTDGDYWSGTTSLNGTLTVWEDGDYTYIAPATVQHISSDLLNDVTVTVSYNDGNGPDVTQSITLDVSDTAPSIGNPVDTILTNEVNNVVTGVNLDIITGQDKPIGIVLTPDTLGGFAVDTTGALLTSTVDDGNGGTVTYNLLYQPTIGGAPGSITAYQANPITGTLILDSNSDPIPVFTLTPDMSAGIYTGTYSISIDGKLDGAAYSAFIDYGNRNTVSTGGNENDGITFMIDSNPNITADDLHITASGVQVDSTPNVNFAPGVGIGVGNTKIDGGEVLTFEFDKGLSAGTTFTLSHYGSDDELIMNLHSDGQLIDSSDYSYSISGGVVTIDYLESGLTFDQIDFGNAKTQGNGYSIISMNANINYEDAGIPHSIYVDVDVTDTDYDIASGAIDITFDNDGVFGYDPESVMDGGAGTDTLITNQDINIDFSALGNIDSSKINDIETIDLRGEGSNIVTNLTIADVLDMTDSSNTLQIIGDSGIDSVQKPAGHWTPSTDVTKTIDDIVFNEYVDNVTDPTVTLLVQQDIDEAIV